MKKVLFIFLFFSSVLLAFAQTLVAPAEINFVLEAPEAASELLVEEDEFTKALSPFDRSSRLKTSREVSDYEYKNFIKMQTEGFTVEECEKLKKCFSDFAYDLRNYKMLFPQTVRFIKTTGLEEGNSAYTRGKDKVVLCQKIINKPVNELYGIVVHELFHIFTKNNPEQQEALYNKIGFYKTQELEYPSNISPFKITNPDSVRNNYYFNAVVNGKTVKVMPVLVARGNYDEQRGGEFFSYMTLAFAAIKINEKNCSIFIEDGRYKIFYLKQLENFYQMVGKNTDYIIGPEEILADNFELLITGDDVVHTPEILTQMKSVLKS